MINGELTAEVEVVEYVNPEWLGTKSGHCWVDLAGNVTHLDGCSHEVA